jgi:hypothetical protein
MRQATALGFSFGVLGALALKSAISQSEERVPVAATRVSSYDPEFDRARLPAIGANRRVPVNLNHQPGSDAELVKLPDLMSHALAETVNQGFTPDAARGAQRQFLLGRAEAAQGDIDGTHYRTQQDLATAHNRLEDRGRAQPQRYQRRGSPSGQSVLIEGPSRTLLNGENRKRAEDVREKLVEAAAAEKSEPKQDGGGEDKAKENNEENSSQSRAIKEGPQRESAETKPTLPGRAVQGAVLGQQIAVGSSNVAEILEQKFGKSHDVKVVGGSVALPTSWDRPAVVPNVETRIGGGTDSLVLPPGSSLPADFAREAFGSMPFQDKGYLSLPVGEGNCVKTVPHDLHRSFNPGHDTMTAELPAGMTPKQFDQATMMVRQGGYGYQSACVVDGATEVHYGKGKLFYDWSSLTFTPGNDGALKYRSEEIRADNKVYFTSPFSGNLFESFSFSGGPRFRPSIGENGWLSSSVTLDLFAFGIEGPMAKFCGGEITPFGVVNGKCDTFRLVDVGARAGFRGDDSLLNLRVGIEGPAWERSWYQFGAPVERGEVLEARGSSAGFTLAPQVSWRLDARTGAVSRGLSPGTLNSEFIFMSTPRSEVPRK